MPLKATYTVRSEPNAKGSKGGSIRTDNIKFRSQGIGVPNRKKLLSRPFRNLVVIGFLKTVLTSM